MPSPSSVEFGKGAFTFSHETVISVEDRQQQEIAEQFAWLFACPAGFVPKVFMNAEDADVVLRCDQTMEPESYRIEVERKKISISASGPAGFFYAFQTLRQTLPEEIASSGHMDGQLWTVPVMVVHDVPRFAHRCLKVDINEHYIPLDELMAFVEYMSMLKLNHLHLFGYGLYSDDDFDRLVSHASGFHVSVVRGDGKNTPLYSCPDDIVSRIFSNVAALAEVAWSDKDVLDEIQLNRAVDVIDAYMKQTVLGYSKSVYNVGLAYLR
jgi:N-acetyl-beta-hexosaminidase